MESGGTTPAGSGRDLRPDPFALPVRFPASDAGADGQIRQVEIDRERVTVRRAVRGIPMKVGLAVSAYRGVSLRLQQGEAGEGATIAVTLEHDDRALSVPLFAAADFDDVIAVWKAWARVLQLPLLLVERSGVIREAFPRLGAVEIDRPTPRRRRRSALRRRRPSILLRRKAAKAMSAPAVHRGEREIIARN
jgi:hypothetical protein